MSTESPTENEVAECMAAINAQEAIFAETRIALEANIAFWEKHREILLKFAYDGLRGWDLTFNFSNYGGEKAKEIARALGADGWVRKKNPFSCGVIDWAKEIDGIVVVIRNAEKAPELRPEVRIA